MGCEQYSISLMALLDGEVSEAEREEIEAHLGNCYHCHERYESYRYMHELTCAALPPAPAGFTWDTYYRGVCSKMESRASWAAWSVVSLLLVIAGSLMIFGFPHSALPIVVGSIAFSAGAGLAFLGYFCNCSR